MFSNGRFLSTLDVTGEYSERLVASAWQRRYIRTSIVPGAVASTIFAP